MEQIKILLDDGTGEEYDKALHKNPLPILPDAGSLLFVTKDNATVQGSPAVMIMFEVKLPDGTICVAQTTMTYRLFYNTTMAITAKYGVQAGCDKTIVEYEP